MTTQAHNTSYSISRGSGTTVISNFTGVGRGVRLSPNILADADSLAFTGAGLTAQTMLLTQVGKDLEISFEGISDTTVILKDFKLEDLDNLTKPTGASADWANIFFDGQTTIQDSFDVINANFQLDTVYNTNSVTFLNDRNNKTRGRDNSNDVINGQGGDDFIDGRGGDDHLRGGEGNDHLLGGAGNDILKGDAGHDVLDGGSGNDQIVGGTGSDRLIGSLGRDYLDGGEGIDAADYRALGQPVTLTYKFAFEPNPDAPIFTTGRVFNYLGVQSTGVDDQLVSIEKIIAPVGQNNGINLSAYGNRSIYTPATFLPGVEIDLQRGRMSFSAIKSILDQGSAESITVDLEGKFNRVIGTPVGDRIVGSNGDDLLDGAWAGGLGPWGPPTNGGPPTNILVGGEGNDTLIAYQNDQLTGGQGSDYFQLTGYLSFQRNRGGTFGGAITPNTITDFDRTEGDRLWINSSQDSVFNTGVAGIGASSVSYILSAFKDLQGQSGALTEEQLITLGSTPTSQTRFIYDASNGDLFYLPSAPTNFSNGLSPSQVKVASLIGAPMLQASDIMVI